MGSSESVDASLLEEVERLRLHVLQLERREQEMKEAQAALDERTQLALLTSDVSGALIQNLSLQECLQHCAQAIVNHLGAAFARIWTLNEEAQVLELVASAGLYTHLDGPHGRVPVGMFKIGHIAAERQPHLTNSVIGDLQVSDQEWARREGMVSFAGYPLLVDSKLVGVVALFAQMPLSPIVLEALASISNSIALGIERKHVEEERASLLTVAQQAAAQARLEGVRLSSILDNLTDGFMIFDEQWRYRYINAQAMPYTGKPWQELLGKNVWEEFPELVGSPFYQHYRHALYTQEPVAFEIFSAVLSSWFDIHAYPIPGGVAVYFRNISDRKQAEEERIRLWGVAETARAEAEAALQVRNDFLSSVSHDLKTPLAVMRGNVQLFQRRLKREEHVASPWAAERLEIIEASITKMNGMVEGLLDVARLQTGQKLDLEMRVLSLPTLVKRVCREQQETTKRHRLLVQVPTEDIFVRGDPLRLDRVLTNLLANAIKYSPEGGSITVNVAYEEEHGQQWIGVRVCDGGLGIPAADLSSIFDPFYRATNVRGRIQGTGVGLASVAQVITEHGGKITVSSDEGQGSCFRVQLPPLLDQRDTSYAHE
jgi:PAS domain S-box-containing protein